MIVITAQARLKDEHREAALAAAAEMCRASRAEDGCEDYRLWISAEDPSSVMIFEKWADDDALTTHMATPHMATFITAIGPALDGGMDVIRHEVSSSGSLI